MNLFQQHGAQAQKPTRYTPIFTSRFFTGLWTNRNPLRSPLGVFYAEGWHLGATDVLSDGLNVELSNRLTLIRRPGNIQYSTATIPSPNRFYSFQRNSDGIIQLIVDTATDIKNLLTGSATSLFTKSNDAGQT